MMPTPRFSASAPSLRSRSSEHRDRDADREPGLQAAVQCAVELGDHLVGANERRVGRLEEVLRKIAHGGLAHVEHGARDHPAHAALSNRLRRLRREVIARIGEARRSRTDQLELAQARSAQRVARVHVRFDDPQPFEKPFGARDRLVGQSTTELLRIVDMRVEDAGQRELAAGIDDVGVRITRRDLLRFADGNDLVSR